MDTTDNPARERSFRETLTAVAWSFIGLRRKSDFEHDVGRMNPLYVIVAGLLATGLFVGILLAVVHWVLAK